MPGGMSSQVLKPCSHKKGTIKKKVLRCFHLVFFETASTTRILFTYTSLGQWPITMEELILLSAKNLLDLLRSTLAQTDFAEAQEPKVTLQVCRANSCQDQLFRSRMHKECGALNRFHSVDSGPKVPFLGSSWVLQLSVISLWPSTRVNLITKWLDVVDSEVIYS